MLDIYRGHYGLGAYSQVTYTIKRKVRREEGIKGGVFVPILVEGEVKPDTADGRRRRIIRFLYIWDSELRSSI